MKEEKRYVIALEDNEEDMKELFINGEEYFTLQEAREQIIWLNKVYPSNKGLYSIYELNKVKTEIQMCSCGEKAEFICD
jgi:hypothetical protein